MSYTDKLLSSNKLGSVIGYLQTLKNCNVDVSALQQSINVENKKNLVELQQKPNKQEAQLNEIVSILGSNKLKIFLKSKMKFNNYESMVEQLLTINITTYENLEKAIEKNQFIKRCRSNGKKVLSSKQIKAIMYFVLEKLQKLKQLVKEQEQKTEEIDIFDIDFSNMIVKETQKKNTIEQLKNKRINLSNLMKLTREQGLEDTDDLEKEIKELDTKINDYYMSLSEEQCLGENIEELVKYMNTIQDNTDEVDRVKSIIHKYSTLMNLMEDSYKQNYQEEVIAKPFGAFDKELEDFVEKNVKEDVPVDLALPLLIIGALLLLGELAYIKFRGDL